MPGGDYDGVGDRHITDYDYEVGADADYNTYHMSYIDEMVLVKIMMVIMVITMLMIMVMIMAIIMVMMMTKTFVTRSSPVQGEVAQHCVFI